MSKTKTMTMSMNGKHLSKSMVLFCLTLVFVVGLPLHLSAQSFFNSSPGPAELNSMLLGSDSSQSVIRVFGLADSRSNSLNASFTNKLLFGGFIEEHTKDKVAEKLDDVNRFGAQAQLSFQFALPAGPSQNQFWWTGEAGYRWMQQTRFTDDFFTLLFYGNAPTAGQLQDLGNHGMHYLSFQYYNAGFIKRFENNDRQIQFAANAGFLQGIGQLRGEINQGTFFTSADGSLVEMNLDFNLEFSDQSSKTLNSLNGAGFISNFYFASLWRQSGVVLEISARELGKAWWNNPGIAYGADSSWSFEGFDVRDLESFQQTSISTQQDSIFKELGLDFKEGSYARMLPAHFSLRLSKKMADGRSVFGLGADYRTGVYALPLIYLKAHRNFADGAVGAAAMVSWGGHGTFEFGLEGNVTIAKQLLIGIGSNNPAAFIAPQSVRGSSIFVSLSAHL